MRRVILDTNFLVYCAENKIDYRALIEELLNEGHELAVPEQVVEELKEISSKAKKLSDRRAAFLALRLLEHNNVSVVKAEGKYADEAILKLVRIDSIVATLDSELRKKLSKTRIIVVKGDKSLAFD